VSKKFFSWTTKFKSIIVVDNELFNNEYKITLHLKPVTADLQEQSLYFERLKLLFESIFNNTITISRHEKLYKILEKETHNRFIELPNQPYDQLMAAVCFTKASAVSDGKILINELELSSFQGDGITYRSDKDGDEIKLLDVDNWWSKPYNKFYPWWLRPDTATYDKILEKGIYTGHYRWITPEGEPEVVDKEHETHAKIFEFNPKVLDGDKDKNK
tara:strand:+ start:236 stop:883 length:648 start_codon:yes stop_codon:yes gene_type:complete